MADQSKCAEFKPLGIPKSNNCYVLHKKVIYKKRKATKNVDPRPWYTEVNTDNIVVSDHFLNLAK